MAAVAHVKRDAGSGQENALQKFSLYLETNENEILFTPANKS